ncbi:hypothetical protein [Bacteriophage sp.]|nr:hypothetical protein [Bacteriophage sp.]UOF80104.1 hypothetical protein [Bacteriophage sp.]
MRWRRRLLARRRRAAAKLYFSTEVGGYVRQALFAHRCYLTREALCSCLSGGRPQDEIERDRQLVRMAEALAAKRWPDAWWLPDDKVPTAVRRAGEQLIAALLAAARVRILWAREEEEDLEEIRVAAARRQAATDL